MDALLTIDSKLSIVFSSHSILMINKPKQPNHQVLPPSGPAREALREKGQFWTPQWLAKIMAAWVVAERPSTLFDPAVGPGTFFAAARDVGFAGNFAGFEVDDTALTESYKLGLNPAELHETIIGDFIGQQISRAFPAIISNPPYIRHHRLSLEQKKELRQLSQHCLGFPLDGRVGLHIYFLLKCLDHLAPNGRLAFLLPADVCEGVSSTIVWKRLGEKFRIDAVLTFDKSTAPFPNVDTNAMVFLLSRRQPSKQVRWLRVSKPDSEARRLRDRQTPADALSPRSSGRAHDGPEYRGRCQAARTREGQGLCEQARGRRGEAGRGIVGLRPGEGRCGRHGQSGRARGEVPAYSRAYAGLAMLPGRGQPDFRRHAGRELVRTGGPAGLGPGGDVSQPERHAAQSRRLDGGVSGARVLAGIEHDDRR